MARIKPECQHETSTPDLETYMKEVDHVTADMKRFVHKMRKIKSQLLGPAHKPSLGRS